MVPIYEVVQHISGPEYREKLGRFKHRYRTLCGELAKYPAMVTLERPLVYGEQPYWWLTPAIYRPTAEVPYCPTCWNVYKTRYH